MTSLACNRQGFSFRNYPINDTRAGVQTEITYIIIGVRGMPERDIESLGVMGLGLEAARRFFRRRRRRRPPNLVCLQDKTAIMCHIKSPCGRAQP